MTKYERLFVLIPSILAACIAISSFFVPPGVLIGDGFSYAMYALFIPFSLSLFYCLWKGGDPAKRKVNVFTVILAIVFAFILIFIGYFAGHSVGKALGGNLVKFTAMEIFQEKVTCIKADKNRYTGWVNFVHDSAGNELKIEGFDRFCDVIRNSKSEKMFTLSGRQGSLGRIVEKVEFVGEQ